MHAEISTLFSLGGMSEIPVREAHIGGGLHIEECNREWLDAVRTQCPKVAARELLEFAPPYTHRFFLAGKGANPERVSEREKQPFFQATVLSRIVKPTSIPFDNVWVTSSYPDYGEVRHHSDFWVNGLSVAFLSEDEGGNTITSNDAIRIAELWESFRFLLDNEPDYRRIVRAIKSYEFAHYIYWAEQNHSAMHAALESLVYFGPKENGAQITKRLPLLLPDLVTGVQAEAIYQLHNDFKHEAQPLQQITTPDGTLAESDRRRSESVSLLRKCVRELLLRAISDQTFAQILCDHNLMKEHYGVTTGQGIM